MLLLILLGSLKLVIRREMAMVGAVSLCRQREQAPAV